MNANGIEPFVAMCAGETRCDRATVETLVRCAVAADEIDCPLGALVRDGDSAAWSGSARRLLDADARALDPILLGAVFDCAARRRRGDACPLAPTRVAAP